MQEHAAKPEGGRTSGQQQRGHKRVGYHRPERGVQRQSKKEFKGRTCSQAGKPHLGEENTSFGTRRKGWEPTRGDFWKEMVAHTYDTGNTFRED